MKKMVVKFIPRLKTAEQTENYPQPSIKFLPDWYRNIPTFENGDKHVVVRNGLLNSTVKRCVPFLDALSCGYTFFLEEDIYVELREGDAPYFNWRTSKELVSFHDASQFEGVHLPEGYFPFIAKWNNPWAVELPKGYSLLITHPMNRFDLPFQTLSGLVDADSYKLSIHLPFVIKRGWSGIIERGTPIAQAVPVKREEWVSQVEKFDEDKVERENIKYFSKIDRSYKNQHWTRKIWS